MGLQLHIESPDDAPIYSKNGGAPGYSTQVVFTTNPPALVVLLSNVNGTEGLLPLGKSILDHLHANPALP